MEISALVMSFYLLFPVYDPAQEFLSHKLEDDFTSGPSLYAHDFERRISDHNELLDKLSSVVLEEENVFADLGDLDFVDMDEDPSSILYELEHPEFGPQGEGTSIAARLGFENVAEAFYTSSEERLKLFEFGEEFFSPMDSVSGKKSSVSVNSDEIVRTEYDDLFRILERTVWKNASNYAGTEMKERLRYTYAGPSSMLPNFRGEEFLLENTYRETRFSGKNPTQVLFYAVSKDDAGRVKRNLKNRSDFHYDAKGRLSVDEESVFFDDGTSRVQKYIYTYSVTSKLPAVDFYEDGVLRMRTESESDLDYVQTIFFDGDARVVTRYKNGTLFEEIFFLGDEEKSRRTFDE